jgi:hypothetical protein
LPANDANSRPYLAEKEQVSSMTEEQEKAARAVERALKKCAAANLGVYVYDGSVQVCPQPDGRHNPEWDHHPSRVCDEIGESLHVPNLDCDGGAGC